MRRIVLIATFLFFSQPALAVLKKCADDNGRLHYYNTIIPPECQNKATVEMNKLGVVIRTHDIENNASVTEQDTAQKEAGVQQQTEAKRRDTVLLNTYTSTQEIDWAMERNVHPVELAIAGVEKRLEIAKSQLHALQQQAIEAEKSGNPILASIQKDMIPVKRDIHQLQNELKKNHERIKNLQEKFTADKKRFQDLKAQAY